MTVPPCFKTSFKSVGSLIKTTNYSALQMFYLNRLPAATTLLCPESPRGAAA
jgi:hypothetical protein